MTFTKYRPYSTEELLQLCAEKRALSPLIEELCQRIEENPIVCPVCEAEL